MLSKNSKLFSLFLVSAVLIGTFSLKRHRVETRRSLASVGTLALDPFDAGSDLPLRGRSLFDQLFARKGVDGDPNSVGYDIPFPFSKLVERIETYLAPGLDPSETGRVKGVLIPIGRSLQRNAAAPDHYFKSPRVVIFVDSPTRQSSGQILPTLKDRIYIGYQERVGILEVISYNEEDGRFEFQVVHDYRPSMKPQVFQASRVTCLSCHQNHTPIFSVRNWLETNSNPEVQAALTRDLLGGKEEPGITDLQERLTGTGDQVRYHGVSVFTRELLPNQFQDATERAQHLPVLNKIWKEACGLESQNASLCRSSALELALRFRLVGDLDPGFQHDAFKNRLDPLFAQAWGKLWPQGLLIPNPNIPNRDPFRDIKPPGTHSVSAAQLPVDVSKVLVESNVPADKDPANQSRPAFNNWRVIAGEEGATARFVTLLASQFQADDLMMIDDGMNSRGGTQVQLQAGCGVRFAPSGAPGDGLNGRYDIACATDQDSGTENGLRLRLRLSVQNGQVLDGGFDSFFVREQGETCNLKGVLSALGVSACERLVNVVPVGRLSVQGEGASLELELRQKISKLGVRRRSGKRVSALQISWPKVADEGAKAVLTLKDDFTGLRQTLSQVAPMLDPNVFSRTQFLTVLRRSWGDNSRFASSFGVAPSELPAPEMNSRTTIRSPELQGYVKRCSTCHDNTDGVPTNFLNGTEEQVRDGFLTCAPRILYKLYEWNKPDQKLAKPMPRPNSLKRDDGTNMPVSEWLGHPDLESLRVVAKQKLNEAREKRKVAPEWSIEEVLRQPMITKLPKCLEGP